MAAPVVILLGGVHQPYIALLDQIGERETARAIALGHADDQPQIAQHEPRPSSVVARGGESPEVEFLFGRQPRVRADVA